MNFIKRFGLMLVVNLLIMVVITVLLNVFNIHPYLQANGINYQSLMIFCLIYGFAGSFISLFLSKFMAKMAMGVKIIDPQASHGTAETWLLQTVHRLAQTAGLSKMPEVGIYESSEMNAFATGPTRSNSLVAVSTGILQKMNRDELEGVLAHEVAHISNGDMVTMTLVQGMVNAFGMFLSRVLAHLISTVVDERKAPVVRMIATILLDIVFNILGMFVVAYYSRRREFRADHGGALYGGREKMIAALQRLQQEHAPVPAENSAVATLQISNRRKWLFGLLSTHPALEDRIAALQSAR